MLEALASEASVTAGGLTITELAVLTERHRNLVSRTTADLIALGLVDRDPNTRRMRLSWRLYARSVRITDERLRHRSRDLLRRLAEGCGESAYTVIRAGTEAVTLAEASPEQAVVVASWVGRAWPVARSDAGPMLLAALEDDEIRRLLGEELPPATAARAPATLESLLELIADARESGLSVLDEQAGVDTASAAAPVQDHRDRTIAAIVVTGPSERVCPRLETISTDVISAAARLSELLGASPSTPATVAARPMRRR